MIEFPCEYPIKIMGPYQSGFRQEMVDIVRKHAPELTEGGVRERFSRNGNYISITVTIKATGEDQLAALFQDLKSTGHISLVL
jgi:hypothetical protein|tara:strand:+ start:1301 stop:1549 length:249 start_codon:yes stop_codon:yes gene_type:complete